MMRTYDKCLKVFLKNVTGGMEVGVFLKYISKNMLEKKGRFFLLIFSIMISTALFVFSLGAVDVILDGYTDTLKHSADGKDISIYSNTEDVYISENDFDHAGLSAIEGQLRMIGVINEDDKITYVNLVGMKNCNRSLSQGSMPETSNEPIGVISERIADEKNLNIGDKFTVYLNGERTDITIQAIAAPRGMFYQDTESSFIILMPYEYMNERMGANGKYNFITAVTDTDSVKFVEEFNENNKAVKSESLSDLSMYRSMLDSTETTVYLMFAIVCIICCIIIHGAFKLIITERMTVIGTFMSQGATKNKIQNILLMESLLYGIVGGIVGVALGEVILYFANKVASPLYEYGIYMDFNIRIPLMILGVIFAVGMCVLSALMPVRKIRKLPVKDVILNRLETKHKGGEVRFVLGILLLILSIVGAVNSGEWTVKGCMFFGLAGFVGLIMFLRKFLKYASGWLSGVFKKKPSIFLALNNIKTSKLLRGNITLLVISLSSVLLIASVGTSLTETVIGAYDEMSYDYGVYNIIDNNSDTSTTDLILDKLNSLDCVKKDSILPIYDANALVNNELFFIEGAEPEKYANYNEYLRLNSGENAESIKALQASTDDAVMISTLVSKKSGKNEGDYLDVEVDGETYSLRIVGVFDGRLENNGRMMIVKSETIRNTFHHKEAYNVVFEVNGDHEAAEKQFKSYLADLGATYKSKEDQKADNVEGNRQFIMLLSIFAYLAMIVASIGIFNNIAISFQQRRREFAVMASVGLNGKKRKRLVFTENMFCVFWSIALAVPFTILMCKISSKIMKFIDLPMEIDFDLTQVPQYSLVLIAVIFIASLSTMKKSKKLNVVQELKYE